MAESLFIQQGNTFTPTEKALGPWGPGMLHGGASAGLIGHALDEASGRDELQFARVSLDMFRPVPQVPLTVESRIVRDGKRVQIIDVSVFGNGKEVARGTGLKMCPKAIELPDGMSVSDETLPSPDSLATVSIMGTKKPEEIPPGLHFNLETKRVCGFAGQGEGKAWFRMPVPVVAHKPMSPFVHMCLISDFGNGTGQFYVKNSAGSINADITLYLHRIPESDWVGFSSKAHMQLNGIGVILTNLCDTKGPIGHISQAIMPQPLPGA